jgi:hypothetical protein
MLMCICFKVTALDRLDGGFTFVIRVPGVPVKKALIVDCYLPPREMDVVQEDIRVMIQYFSKNIALRHLKKLDKRYASSNIQMPSAGTSDGDGRQFPSPVIPGSCHYQYSWDATEGFVGFHTIIHLNEHEDIGLQDTHAFEEPFTSRFGSNAFMTRTPLGARSLLPFLPPHTHNFSLNVVRKSANDNTSSLGLPTLAG